MPDDSGEFLEAPTIDLSGVEWIDDAELDIMRQTVIQMSIMGVIKLLTNDKSDRKQLGGDISELYAQIALQEELRRQRTGG